MKSNGDQGMIKSKSRSPFDFAQGGLSAPLKYAALRMADLLDGPAYSLAAGSV
jgi:hypothetical protein